MKCKTSLSKNRRTAYTITGFNPPPPPSDNSFNFTASNLNTPCMMLNVG